MDHDQRFKEMLREFVWELLSLFLPGLAARLLREVEWQSQEVFTNPPFGLVRRVDLLALVKERTAASSGPEERLLHLEVESAGSLTEVRKKIGYYYPTLRAQRNRPVTTLALYLRVGLEGQGWDEYAEQDEGEGDAPEKVLSVRWRYVGLPALPAERYLTSNNWLGVALSALMKIEPERKPWLRAEILRRLALECKENDYRKLLLINCVDAYLPMEGEQQDVYDRLISQDARYQETKAMILTTYDKGMLAGLRTVVIDLAGEKCGAPDEATCQRLNQIDDFARLRRLCKAALTARSWDELLASE